MLVCICKRVSDRDIDREICKGNCSLESLKACLGVGTKCGKCIGYTQKMLIENNNRDLKMAS